MFRLLIQCLMVMTTVTSLSVGNSRRAFVNSALIGGGTWLVQSSAAGAYERDVGGDGRSAVQAAFNAQARETNARLEKSGFKLDTKEEESSRLSDALGSYSYSATESGKNNKAKKAKSTSNKK